jgi:hypothetical protein
MPPDESENCVAQSGRGGQQVNSGSSQYRPGDVDRITPNQFEGSDIQRIGAAIAAARGTTNCVVIPAQNADGKNRWLIDSAILLPSNMTVILDNCTIQLSDSCVDNIFRSDNVGDGTTEVRWNHNIRIIGIGNATLRGATNPRSTGEGKALALNSEFESPMGRGKATYGTDAGKEGVEQKGNWRNHGIVMAYVDGFELTNVTVENTHCWAVTHERVRNADLSRIRISNPPEITVDGETHYVANRDGINLRQGCKNFRIDDISGETGDDFIALTLLGVHSPTKDDVRLSRTMVTTSQYVQAEDDIEDIFITNIKCKTKNHGIALRTIDIASIHGVFIDGVIVTGNPKIKSHQTAMLFGGRGYGTSSPAGGIRDVHAMNLMSDSPSALIHVEAAIADCTFMNGIYSGEGQYPVSYHDFRSDTPKYTVSEGNRGRDHVTNVREINIVAVRRVVDESTSESHSGIA